MMEAVLSLLQNEVAWLWCGKGCSGQGKLPQSKWAPWCRLWVVCSRGGWYGKALEAANSSHALQVPSKCALARTSPTSSLPGLKKVNSKAALSLRQSLPGIWGPMQWQRAALKELSVSTLAGWPWAWVVFIKSRWWRARVLVLSSHVGCIWREALGPGSHSSWRAHHNKVLACWTAI